MSTTSSEEKLSEIGLERIESNARCADFVSESNLKSKQDYTSEVDNPSEISKSKDRGDGDQKTARETSAHENQAKEFIAPDHGETKRKCPPTKKRSENEVSPDDKVSIHSCIYCPKFFSDTGKLKRHLNTHDKQYSTCDICLETLELKKTDYHYDKFHREV